jgi:hypothetical protein
MRGDSAKEKNVPVMDDPLQSTAKKKSTVKTGQKLTMNGGSSNPPKLVAPKGTNRADSNEQQIRYGRKYLQTLLGIVTSSPDMLD